MTAWPPLADRYWTPEPNTGCHLWTGSIRGGMGYGRRASGVSAKSVAAHRAAWIEAHGAIPPGLFVCHRCDVPACINVAHLFLGTHLDNMRDKVAKGRQPKGEDHHALRLSDEQVLAIRARVAAGELRKTLAVEFGVTPTTIGRVADGRQPNRLRDPSLDVPRTHCKRGHFLCAQTTKPNSRRDGFICLVCHRVQMLKFNRRLETWDAAEAASREKYPDLFAAAEARITGIVNKRRLATEAGR